MCPMAILLKNNCYTSTGFGVGDAVRNPLLDNAMSRAKKCSSPNLPAVMNSGSSYSAYTKPFAGSSLVSSSNSSEFASSELTDGSTSLQFNSGMVDAGSGLMDSCGGMTEEQNVADQLANALVISSGGAPSAPLANNSSSHANFAPSTYGYLPAASPAVAVQKDVVYGTTYFYTQDDCDVPPVVQDPDIMMPYVPQFTVYPGCLPHVAHMKLKTSGPSFFMPDEMKMEILNRQVCTALQLDDVHGHQLPREVDKYHSLYPLEPPPPHPLHKSSTFGYPTTVYKAINSKDNLTYCLRRIHGYRLVNTKCMAAIELWKKIQHPNLVQLCEVFTTKAFGDLSMVFVYNYHPAAETLMIRHFTPNPVGNTSMNVGQLSDTGLTLGPTTSGGDAIMTPGGMGVPLPEALIWTYIVQLSSILRAVHAHGLACRVMDPTKILLTDKTRMRVNCVGIFDVLSSDANSPVLASQMEHYQEDLVSLGRIVLALANNSLQSLQNLRSAVMFVSQAYSTDLKNLIIYLMTPPSRPRSINDIMPMIGARFYSQIEASHIRNDILENELSKEVENGRLFKLLCKLGAINERPEYSMDAAWSETGDRYMLKLFRDYVFHQVDSNGAPWLDMAHVVQCLNKLNAGVPEKICLSSRDDDIILLVSYAELKRCIETSFNELVQSSSQSLTSASIFT